MSDYPTEASNKAASTTPARHEDPTAMWGPLPKVLTPVAVTVGEKGLNYPQFTTNESARSSLQPQDNTKSELEEAKRELQQLQQAQEDRVRAIMKDESFNMSVVPSVEALRAERVRLSELVRHHKDEQDSLALDIESQEGAAELYQLAARVKRIENFSRGAQEYVEKVLPAEVEQVIEADQQNSEEEIALFIQELQTKRETALQRIAAAQEQSSQRASAAKAAHAEREAPEGEATIQNTQTHQEEAASLAEKIKKFKAIKTKLSSDIYREKQQAKQSQQQLQARIRNAELANARDSRLCRELNDSDTVLVTNAQMLLSQLNVEHYGIDDAPSSKEVMAAIKDTQLTPESSAERSFGRRESATSNGSRASRTASQSSRQQSISKPPLVASKPTASQRNRDDAMQREREEQSASRRRNGSEAGSFPSSRRQSLSKPPLVASKPTASQRSRDDAALREREEQSASRTRSRRISLSSEARPPSVASKSTASQRNRESAAVY